MEPSRATSFGAWAEEYDAWRPTYPDAAVDWLVPASGAHAVEVGAGTRTSPLTFDALCVRWHPESYGAAR